MIHTSSYTTLSSVCVSRYTGKVRDTESGSDYFGARYYASNMGRFMSPDWSGDPSPVPWADMENPQSLNLYSYVGNNPLSRTDPNGHATDPCNGNPNCVTVTADPEGELPLLSLGRAMGHHFVDQSLIKSKDAWDSLAGNFFRRWATGPLSNPGAHRGFSAAHRLNSAQIRSIVEKVEQETGRSMGQWTEADVEKCVEEVRSADGDVGKFLGDLKEYNPTIRTVQNGIGNIMDAARAATDFARTNGKAIAGEVEEGIEETVQACESGQCPIP